MTRWEYRHTPAATPLGELNALGADGWEVVGPRELTEQVGGGRRTEEHVLLLRRPAPTSTGMVTGD
ncbi:hypothetical protein FHU33_3898 [Blastococcus colisei]|uniref:DUF4177 domain-containing protein n=1 Tax=Blastococcus colisei TaxID=1564162 RepID=A0A543PJZ5_9ACTN|nr:hypothetical protein [Blastococcus colisei]TQN44396.1 hypothetical protein FHU33_3898 [Blastococcus colisei]